MKTCIFDYDLPPELIAQEPVYPRDSSRLLLVDRDNDRIGHKRFSDIVDVVRDGDCLVLNDSRVIPARLIGRKKGTRGQAEIFLVKKTDDMVWQALVKPSRRLPEGTVVEFDGGELTATVGERLKGGPRLVEFACREPFDTLIAELGKVPLPPYIKKPLEDDGRYQTVYAANDGSVAAPTAGLHFTPDLLEMLAARGVEIVKVTLDVGPGTFRPVKAENAEEHEMENERFCISAEAAGAVNKAKREGRRVIAAGTTSVRVLESAAREDGTVTSDDTETGLFIYPGFEFKVVDCLLTNFHLPRSSLLMLVCAFAGTEPIMGAYKQAIYEGYRFYSFGDAMFIW